jgi:hypothetical protein
VRWPADQKTWPGVGLGGGTGAGRDGAGGADFFLVVDEPVFLVLEVPADLPVPDDLDDDLLVLDDLDLVVVVADAFFTAVELLAWTVAPAPEDGADPVVAQMLPFEALGTEPGQPQDQSRSTGALMPAT